MNLSDFDFNQKLAEALDIDADKLEESTLLADIDWDSLSSITFIALAGELLGKSVDSKIFTECATYGELLSSLSQA